MSVAFSGYKSNIIKRLSLVKLGFAPKVLEVDNALCVNLKSIEGNRYQFTGGLYDSDGQYIHSSGLVTNHQTVLGGGDCSTIKATDKLSGRSLYLGLTHLHYGHFLLETLTRLCFFNREQLKQFDHIIVMPSHGVLPPFVLDIFKNFGIDERLHVVNAPVTLERVVVPEAAVRYPDCVHKRIRHLQILVEGDASGLNAIEQPLFISRSATVPGFTRAIIGEDLIKQNLLENGAVIFNPEQHSIEEQVRIFRQHSVIIGFAGSALHTMLLSGGGKKVIAYSERSVPNVFPLIDLALNNTAYYVKTNGLPIEDDFYTNAGFEPQIINPLPVLELLNKLGVISSINIGEGGVSAVNEDLIGRYHTAKFLRFIVEKASYGDFETCKEEIAVYQSKFRVDQQMVKQAIAGSDLLKKVFK